MLRRLLANFCHKIPLKWSNGKDVCPEGDTPGFRSYVESVSFLDQVIPVTWKYSISVATLSGVLESVLIMVGPMSAICDNVRQQI